MSKVIPNENTWIGFSTVLPVDIDAPTEAELDAAVNVTPFVVSLNPTAQGNAVPTPALDSRFDRSVIGTSQGSFSGDFYRDDDDDLAWDTLPRGTKGIFYVSRFGGTGTLKIPRSGDSLECWPVEITQRAGSAMTSNTVQTFTLAAAVPEPPSEDAICSGGSSATPSAPRNLVATSPAAGIAVLDFDVPLQGLPLSGVNYKVYQGATAQAAQESNTALTSTVQVSGTTARVSGLATGTYYFCVCAVNANGDGTRTASVSVAVA